MKHTIQFRVERKDKTPPCLMYQGEISCHGGISLLAGLIENAKQTVNDSHEMIFGEIHKTELVDKSWIPSIDNP